ncbi:unnamed protein product [Paramecium octaurelia]|uniref:Uncharacterized protein n=1 Tax=Paramecium octaurelia TaxID=43137 RepID=A0A8S1V1M3_PAROT|nr:unnamed protein product [Paramecium octaurelia]
MNQKNNNCHNAQRENHSAFPPTRRGISSFLLKTYSMVMVCKSTLIPLQFRALICESNIMI